MQRCDDIKPIRKAKGQRDRKSGKCPYDFKQIERNVSEEARCVQDRFLTREKRKRRRAFKYLDKIKGGR